jgi:hypothetical protein
MGIAAVQAMSARRQWRALIAPALAPLGMIGYFAWLGTRYHDYLFWSKLERKYWAHRIDWGRRTLPCSSSSAGGPTTPRPRPGNDAVPMFRRGPGRQAGG